MNPEMNSTGSTVITYGYDNDSRLISKVEPAPNAAWGSNSTVTLTYTYDALNRLLDTTYSDGTTQGQPSLRLLELPGADVYQPDRA